jgi:hypothetical protein
MPYKVAENTPHVCVSSCVQCIPEAKSSRLHNCVPNACHLSHLVAYKLCHVIHGDHHWPLKSSGVVRINACMSYPHSKWPGHRPMEEFLSRQLWSGLLKGVQLVWLFQNITIVPIQVRGFWRRLCRQNPKFIAKRNIILCLSM